MRNQKTTLRKNKFQLWLKAQLEAQTPEQLCVKLDVSKGTVYSWLSGHRKPFTKHAVSILKVADGALELKDLV